MSVKIQINSIEALERLIAGDSELELELRKGVAVEILKRHINLRVAHADLDVIRKLEAHVKEITASFEERLKRNLLVETPGANPIFRKSTLLAEEVERLYGKLLRDEVEKALPAILDKAMKNIEATTIQAVKDAVIERIRKSIALK